MSRTNALTLLVYLIVGWFAAALFTPGTLAPAFIAALIIAALIWIVRVLIPNENGEARKDIGYAVGGLLLGIAAGVLVPQLSLDNIGAESLVQTGFLFVFVLLA